MEGYEVADDNVPKLEVTTKKKIESNYESSVESGYTDLTASRENKTNKKEVASYNLIEEKEENKNFKKKAYSAVDAYESPIVENGYGDLLRTTKKKNSKEKKPKKKQSSTATSTKVKEAYDVADIQSKKTSKKKNSTSALLDKLDSKDSKKLKVVTLPYKAGKVIGKLIVSKSKTPQPERKRSSVKEKKSEIYTTYEIASSSSETNTVTIDFYSPQYTVKDTEIINNENKEEINNKEDTKTEIKKDAYVDTNQPPADTRADITETVSSVITNEIKDWNAEYQTLVESNPNLIELYEPVAKLGNAFREAASYYAAIIISERCLSVEKKTIKPINVGGVAGGDKYMVQGILFKFALDFKFGDFWFYGGKERNDKFAIKAAGRELNGMETVWTSWTPGISFPLMAIIDYKGYRVIAISKLPINNKTIVYGSNDGGKTVHASNEKVNEIMKKVGENLNLRGHLVGNCKTPIYGPGDFEGHIGTDGRFYLLDYARLFPPEAPSGNPEERKKEPRAVFYKLLRPQFVTLYKAGSLCSDTFTGWDNKDPSKEEHQRDLIAATKFLFQEIIPKAAQKLISGWISMGLDNKLEEEFDSKNSLKDAYKILKFELTDRIHSEGINLRHLGHVRQEVEGKCASLSEHILTITTCRALKNKLNQEMRNLINKEKVPSDDPFLEIVAKVLTLSLGKGEEVEIIKFWSEITENMKKNFSKIFTRDDLSNYQTKWWREKLNRRVLLVYLLDITNIKLKDNSLKMFGKIKDGRCTFSWFDIASMHPKARQTHVVELANAIRKMQATGSVDNSNLPEKIRLLKMSVEDLKSAIARAPCCPVLTCGRSNLHKELAFLYSKIQGKQLKALSYYESASLGYVRASQLQLPLEDDIYANHSNCLQEFANFLGEMNLMDKRKEILELSKKINSLNEECPLIAQLSPLQTALTVKINNETATNNPTIEEKEKPSSPSGRKKNQQTAIFEGYLLKKSKGNLKTWKKRWFYIGLQENYGLCLFYKTKNNSVTVKGRFPLNSAKIEVLSESSYNKTFCLLVIPSTSLLKKMSGFVLENINPIVLSCETEENMLKWEKELIKASLTPLAIKQTK